MQERNYLPGTDSYEQHINAPSVVCDVTSPVLTGARAQPVIQRACSPVGLLLPQRSETEEVGLLRQLHIRMSDLNVTAAAQNTKLTV
ncbi:uncharacterized protein V6R79_005125 [Siganus canaliculatus]